MNPIVTRAAAAFATVYGLAMAMLAPEGHSPTLWSYAIATVAGLVATFLYLVTPPKPQPQEAKTHMPTLNESLAITDGIPGLPSTVTIALPSVPLDTWEADIANALAPNGVSATAKALLTVVDGAIVLTATEDLEAGSAVSKKFGQGFTVRTNLASVLAFVVPAAGIPVTLAYQATVAA